MHVRGHQDEAPPSSTDVFATNPNYNARTQLPSNLPSRYPATPPPARRKDPRRYIVTPYGASPLDQFVNKRGENYTWNPRSGIYELSGLGAPPITMDYLKTLQYDTTPYGSMPRRTFVRDGVTYQWNPRAGVYEATNWAGTGAATTDQPGGGGGGGGGKVDPYAKIKRDAEQQRLSARTAYMTKLGTIGEQRRLARVGQAEAPAAAASRLAQMSIGGFGGISEAVKQRAGDRYRADEARAVASRVASYADYLVQRLGISRNEALAISTEAVKQADAGAAKIIAEMEKRVSDYDKLLATNLQGSVAQGEEDQAKFEKRISEIEKRTAGGR